ncbi:hypothetical protein EIN_274530 [Entamoeba invadens IP1]|uniref:Maelstrom domain-containing protein n=1 Tax=Entamoeba invadens IP1 TaxID=370355 RepID=A0A0A1U7B9_ENTIV|nr:hypothetical protein EIN_274530 [Entamoeba invadens IP1]ELP87876.1 hypothetical protein EIN_274530 [Entamoeba invadens IP1]|eukprot:XP_004254647.1 hypothetical protein EIN_274530 [Entamoeba invadens IP1]
MKRAQAPTKRLSKRIPQNETKEQSSKLPEDVMNREKKQIQREKTKKQEETTKRYVKDLLLHNPRVVFVFYDFEFTQFQDIGTYPVEAGFVFKRIGEDLVGTYHCMLHPPIQKWTFTYNQLIHGITKSTPNLRKDYSKVIKELLASVTKYCGAVDANVVFVSKEEIVSSDCQCLTTMFEWAKVTMPQFTFINHFCLGEVICDVMQHQMYFTRKSLNLIFKQLEYGTRCDWHSRNPKFHCALNDAINTGILFDVFISQFLNIQTKEQKSISYEKSPLDVPDFVTKFNPQTCGICFYSKHESNALIFCCKIHDVFKSSNLKTVATKKIQNAVQEMSQNDVLIVCISRREPLQVKDKNLFEVNFSEFDQSFSQQFKRKLNPKEIQSEKFKSVEDERRKTFVKTILPYLLHEK